MLVTRIRQLPHKPFCLPMHSHFHQPPPPNLHSSPRQRNIQLAYTQKHATSNKPPCTLNLPHPSTSYSPPSFHRFTYTIKKKIRQPKCVKSHHEIASGPNKHEISYSKLVTAQKSMNSHQDIAYENCAARNIKSHKDTS